MRVFGSLLHHLEEVGLTLGAVSFMVFDECDRLFEMGFQAEVRAIMHKVGDNRQTLLFSATLPAALAEFARAGLRDPEFVRLDVDSKISENLAVAFLTVSPLAPLCLLWSVRVCCGCVCLHPRAERERERERERDLERVRAEREREQRERERTTERTCSRGKQRR